MTTIITIKNSSTNANPLSSLQTGELAVSFNNNDTRLLIGNSTGAISQINSLSSCNNWKLYNS